MCQLKNEIRRGLPLYKKTLDGDKYHMGNTHLISAIITIRTIHSFFVDKVSTCNDSLHVL